MDFSKISNEESEKAKKISVLIVKVKQLLWLLSYASVLVMAFSFFEHLLLLPIYIGSFLLEVIGAYNKIKEHELKVSVFG